MKSEKKLNSKDLFDLAALEIKQQRECNIFSDTPLIQEYANSVTSTFNIGAANEIKKKFVWQHEMGELIKNSLLLTLLK